MGWRYSFFGVGENDYFSFILISCYLSTSLKGKVFVSVIVS